MKATCFRKTDKVYLILRALFNFYFEHSRYPLRNNEKDKNDFISIRDSLIKKYTELTLKSFSNELVSTAIQSLNAELNPVCAVIGGIAGQEIVKVICKNDEPFNNFLFYNLLESSGVVQQIFN